MTATFLGTQSYGTSIQTMYRLSRPLLDRAPDACNVVISQRGDARNVLLGAAYERADGTWAPALRGSWIRCFGPHSERDLAFIDAEIAGA